MGVWIVERKITSLMKFKVMKKILLFVIPVVLIFVASRIYRNTEVETSSSYCNVNPKEYLSTDTEDAVILDVRTQREYDYGHLENAVVIDIYQRDFREKISKLDKNKTYYVYCKTGTRSRSAVNYMLQSGFKKVCNLEGGINYLTRAGVKLVR